jgi:hypothetical protein
MNSLWRFIGLFLLGLLGFGLLIFSQNEQPPLTEDEVSALVTSVRLGSTTPERVAEIIQKRGVGFVINAIYMTELEVKGADPLILQALRKILDNKKETKSVIESEPDPSNNLPPTKLPDGTVLDEKNWPRFLEAVRSKAMAYTSDLPNFICTQVTQRSYRFFPEGWRVSDGFVADLSYYDRKEHYKIISVANKPTTTTTMENLKGARSTGEFGSTLRELFDPATKAVFRLEGPEQSNGRDTVRIGFSVPLETSQRGITYEEESGPRRSIITAYRGRVWVDPGSFQIVRIEDKAINIPSDFPISRSDGSIDYDLAEIMGKKYWLPVRAEMYMVEGARKLHTKNVIEFKRYRKFEAEVKFGDVE